MHRHGYTGRKFHRATGPRQALLTGLAEAVIDHGQIETTLLKAKDTLPIVEKLITKAKKGGLHSRRQIIASLDNLTLAHKLVDEIAPKLVNRDSGYLRIERTGNRRGDNAITARLSFVDDISVKESATSKATNMIEPATSTIATNISEPANKGTKTIAKDSSKSSALSRLTTKLSGRQAPTKPSSAVAPKKAAVRKTFQGSK